jgi:hypothetical protein
MGVILVTAVIPLKFYLSRLKAAPVTVNMASPRRAAKLFQKPLGFSNGQTAYSLFGFQTYKFFAFVVTLAIVMRAVQASISAGFAVAVQVCCAV